MIFRTKRCRITSEFDPQNCPPKEVKNLGAAEPRYVLQLPGLVENCVGLYVPLLEFNLMDKHRQMAIKVVHLSIPLLKGDLRIDVRDSCRKDR